MSIFSDYACGALSDAEFKSECARMNAEDRYDREHEESLWSCDDDENEEQEVEE